MALSFHTFSPNLQSNPLFPPILSSKHSIKLNPIQPRTLRISCSSKEEEIITDETLAKELAIEINKVNAKSNQTTEALKKSRELLFIEICTFTGLKSKVLKKKWDRMDEDEKMVLAKGFVAEWSSHFHPLSAKAVRHMVEKYLQDDEFDSALPGYPNFQKMAEGSQGWVIG